MKQRPLRCINRRLGPAAAAVCLWSLAAGGCFTYHAGPREPGHLLISAATDDINWPARDPAAVEPYRAATFAAMEKARHQSVESSDASTEPEPAAPFENSVRLLFNDICAGGLLRVSEPAEPEQEDAFAGLTEWIHGFHPNAAYLSSYRTDSARFAQALQRVRSRPDSWQQEQDTQTPILLHEGVDVRVPNLDQQPARGILIRFTALLGNSYERAVIAHLQERGWAVVHISTLSSVRSPNEAAILDAHERRSARTSALLDERGVKPVLSFERGPDGQWQIVQGDPHLYERSFKSARAQAEAEIPIPPTGFEPASDSDEDIDTAARLIAAAVDQGLAENAYAAQAALEYLAHRWPESQDLPVAIVGFSAGALAAPAAAVRLGDRVRAVILIGGAADLFSLSQTSPVTDGGVRIAPRGERVSPQLVSRLNERYLAHVRLDPFHAAPMLHDKPILIVHARFDKIVPAELGRQLMSRMPAADRLVFLGGHRALFYMLPRRAAWLGDWLDAAVFGEPAATPAQSRH